MKIKIDKIVKNEHLLDVYIKIPFYRSYKNYIKYFEQFRDNDNFMEPCLDIDGKHIIMTFVLRNKEDILPYIKKGSGVNEWRIWKRICQIKWKR